MNIGDRSQETGDGEMSDKVEKFEDLEVWKESMRLTVKGNIADGVSPKNF